MELQNKQTNKSKQKTKQKLSVRSKPSIAVLVASLGDVFSRFFPRCRAEPDPSLKVGDR